MDLANRANFGPFWAYISQEARGTPTFFLALETLPTHRYSKLPLVLLVLFFLILTWVIISMETCDISGQSCFFVKMVKMTKIVKNCFLASMAKMVDIAKIANMAEIVKIANMAEIAIWLQ